MVLMPLTPRCISGRMEIERTIAGGEGKWMNASQKWQELLQMRLEEILGIEVESRRSEGFGDYSLDSK